MSEEKYETETTKYCEICGKSFKGERRSHFKFMHENICGEDLCGKSLPRKRDLEGHIKSIQDHQCNKCGILFSQSSHLEEHLKNNGWYKNPKCDKCGKSFFQLSHLRAHIKSVHENEWFDKENHYRVHHLNQRQMPH